MARVDLLLNQPSRRAPIRIGDIKNNAPFMILFVEGESVRVPMPVNVTSGNQVLWEQKDFTAGSALGAAVLGSGLDITNVSFDSLVKTGGGVAQSLPTIATANLASGLGGAAGIQDAADLFYHKQGKAVNPNKEMTFNGLGYRSFTFEFELIPLSEAEADAIREFIEFFQEKAMPDYAEPGNKTYYRYPSSWDIEWRNTADFFPKMLPCYLTDYSINYAGAGKLVQHIDGAPVQTNITLTFVEAELHMRDKVRQGFIG